MPFYANKTSACKKRPISSNTGVSKTRPCPVSRFARSAPFQQNFWDGKEISTTRNGGKIALTLLIQGGETREGLTLHNPWVFKGHSKSSRPQDTDSLSQSDPILTLYAQLSPILTISLGHTVQDSYLARPPEAPQKIVLAATDVLRAVSKLFFSLCLAYLVC